MEEPKEEINKSEMQDKVIQVLKTIYDPE
ncbi:MAG: hypothetical protein RL220_389, partial [Bacteroidota bacterium]